jgi:hypothetical protein
MRQLGGGGDMALQIFKVCKDLLVCEPNTVWLWGFFHGLNKVNVSFAPQLRGQGVDRNASWIVRSNLCKMTHRSLFSHFLQIQVPMAHVSTSEHASDARWLKLARAPPRTRSFVTQRCVRRGHHISRSMAAVADATAAASKTRQSKKPKATGNACTTTSVLPCKAGQLVHVTQTAPWTIGSADAETYSVHIVVEGIRDVKDVAPELLWYVVL